MTGPRAGGDPAGDAPVTMWEVRAADGQLEPLLAWVLPRLAGAARVYRSAAGEPRVVVLDPTGEVTDRLSGIPASLIARPPHAWQFEPVGNGKAGSAHLDGGRPSG